jgi:hypothetical protein
MNISIPYIKILSLFTIITISAFLSINFINNNNFLISSKVVEASNEDLKIILKETLNDIYSTNQQVLIKIVNLKNIILKIIKFENIDFVIRLYNETLSWKISMMAICFVENCNISTSDLYSFSDQVVNDKGYALIPTLNIKSNITYYGNTKLYSFFVTKLATNSSMYLKGEYQIRFESQKENVKMYRIIGVNSSIAFFLNGQEIKSYDLEQNSILLLNLYNIELSIEAISI